MATAQVTIRVSPKQLQIIDEALRMYVHVTNRVGDATVKCPTDGFRFTEKIGTLRELGRKARELRHQIGF